MGGRFLRLDYSWLYQGKPQEGSILLGADAGTGEVSAHWVDTWHMGHKVMACQGAADEGGRVIVRGSYAAPPGPDWGWTIELVPQARESLRIVMHNIWPEGRRDLAVEAWYTRVPPPALAEIGQLAVIAADVSRSLAFYRDVLGLTHLFSAGPNLAFLAAGGVRLMLTTPQGTGKAGANSVLYFTVVDVEAVHGAIVQRGAVSERATALTAKMPDHELWIGFVRDPDGNLIGLMEEKRQPA